MLKRSCDTAEYYMVELYVYVLEANDDVNYVLCANKQVGEAMPTQLSYVPTGLAYRISVSSYETGSGVPRHYDVLESDQALLALE